jgi:hypothetical protein
LAWWQREGRIQVKFADLGDFFDKARNPKQHLFDRLHIRYWLASIAFGSSDHLCRITVGKWRDAALYIAKTTTGV